MSVASRTPRISAARAGALVTWPGVASFQRRLPSGQTA